MSTILTHVVRTGKTVESIWLNSHHWFQRMAARDVPDSADNLLTPCDFTSGSSTKSTDRPQPRRVQTYGVVVVTARNPERSRIGRDMSVQSELISRTPRAIADRARAATRAR